MQNGTIPERLAKNSLKYVKARARRQDPVGQVTYRALELVSDGLGVAAKTLRQLGDATQPPARNAVVKADASPKDTTSKATARTRRPAAARKTA